MQTHDELRDSRWSETILEEVVWLSQEARSGILNCWRGRDFRQLLLQDGLVVSVFSSDPKDRLGQRLISRGLITEDQCRAAFEAQRSVPMRLGELLLRDGSLDLLSLEDELNLQAGSVVRTVVHWTSGEFTFEEKCLRLPQNHPLWIDPRQVLFQHMVRETPPPGLQDLVPDREAVLEPNSQSLALELGNETRAVLHEMRAGGTLAQVAARLRLPWQQFSRIAVALGVLGIVRLPMGAAASRAGSGQPVPHSDVLAGWSGNIRVPSDSPDLARSLSELRADYLRTVLPRETALAGILSALASADRKLEALLYGHIPCSDVELLDALLESSRSLEAEERLGRAVICLEAALRLGHESELVHRRLRRLRSKIHNRMLIEFGSVRCKPRLQRPLNQMLDQDITLDEGFVLSLVDGATDIHSLVVLSRLTRLRVQGILLDFRRRGLLLTS